MGTGKVDDGDGQPSREQRLRLRNGGRGVRQGAVSGLLRRRRVQREEVGPAHFPLGQEIHPSGDERYGSIGPGHRGRGWACRYRRTEGRPHADIPERRLLLDSHHGEEHAGTGETGTEEGAVPELRRRPQHGPEIRTLHREPVLLAASRAPSLHRILTEDRRACRLAFHRHDFNGFPGV